MYRPYDPTYPQQDRLDDATSSFIFKKPRYFGVVGAQFRPLEAPFSHKVGFIGSYMKGVASNLYQYYMYQPKVWESLVSTGTLKWPGIVGLRGFMAGEEAAIKGSFGYSVGRGGRVSAPIGKMGAYIGRPVRRGVSYVLSKLMSEEYRFAASRFTRKGLRGFAESMYHATGKSPFWGGVMRFAGRFGTGSVAMGPKSAAIIGKIGTGASYATLAYEAVRALAWAGGSVVRTGASLMDKAARGLQNINKMRYRLPDGYRTPEAATMRSRALAEMHNSRANLRNVMLGNEAYYLHQ